MFPLQRSNATRISQVIGSMIWSRDAFLVFPIHSDTIQLDIINNNAAKTGTWTILTITAYSIVSI